MRCSRTYLSTLVPLLVGTLLSGCVLDPAVLLGSMATAGQPSEQQISAQFDAQYKADMMAAMRKATCKQLTNDWPETKRSLLAASSAYQIRVDSQEQVIAEKQCLTSPGNEGQVAATAPAPVVSQPAAAVPPAVIRPVETPLPVAAAPSVSAKPGLEFCYLYLSSDDYKKIPDALSLVFQDASANVSAQSQMAAIKNFMLKVPTQQPGIWRDVDYRAEQCSTAAGVCFANGKSPKRSVLLRCFVSLAEANEAQAKDREADPTATTVTMP